MRAILVGRLRGSVDDRPPRRAARAALHLPPGHRRRGRLLVGNDESGSMQLHELSPDGTPDGAHQRRPSPAPVAICRARGSVVVSTTTAAPSGRSSGCSTPTTRPRRGRRWRTTRRTSTRLLDVAADQVVYATNRRNGVDFDVVGHTVSTGAERVVWDGGGWFDAASLSPDGRWLALRRLSLLPASTELMLADLDSGEVVAITDPAGPVHWTAPTWLGAGVLVSSSDAGEEFHSVRGFDVGTRRWWTLVAADGQDRLGVPSPDGTQLAVVSRAGRRRPAGRASTPARGWRTLLTSALTGGTRASRWRCRTRASSTSARRWSGRADSSLLGLHVRVPRPIARGVRLVRWLGRRSPYRLERRRRHRGLVTPTSHRVPTPDGEQIPVFVFARRGRRPGPRVLVIHGGPEAAAVRSWNPVIAALALEGHAVVVPNVRGSAGYGRRWISHGRRGQAARLGRRPGRPPRVAAGDRRRPEPRRVVRRVVRRLHGACGAGVPARACGPRGSTSSASRPWSPSCATPRRTDGPTARRSTAGSTPTSRCWRRRHRSTGSATSTRRCSSSTAPTTRECRCPRPSSWSTAVRSRGLECELLVYGDEGHGLAKRANRLDAYPKAFAFLSRHLGSRSIQLTA